MGKKKTQGEYSDFLDGEKLRDNTDIRTILQPSSSAIRDISPPPVRQGGRGSGRQGKGGPKKPPLTHFLCLPLVTDTSRLQLQQGLGQLKDELNKNDLVPSKAVRPVGTLHLTLGVMSLDKTRLEEAKQYLQDLNLHSLLRDISMQILAEKAAEDGTIAENLCAVTIPDTDAVTVSLQSLVPMQAPHKTSILYAEPKDISRRLVPFASVLKERFKEKGFLLEDNRPLKLHATIINTIYARSGSRRGKTKREKSNVDGLNNSENKTPTPEKYVDETYPQDDGTPTTDSLDDKAPTSFEQNQAQAGNQNSHDPGARNGLRFDARPLIASYRHFVWADEVKVDQVQICKMGAKKIWSGDGEAKGEVLDEAYEVVFAKGIYE
ncbi:Nn.00g091540.m01.CDS01 [Neocucurbitaria sp. VM-36]